MASIKAHTFNTVEEAEQAISQINSALGIPVNEDAITRTYCDVIQKDGHIYIQSDEVTDSILGTPTSINIEVTLPI